jgi:hypothetical protein
MSVSHSSFNVTYMVIFWAKNVISTRNDSIEPHFRPKTGYLGTRESKSKIEGGGVVLRIFQYWKYSYNLTFLVIFREKIVCSAKIYLWYPNFDPKGAFWAQKPEKILWHRTFGAIGFCKPHHGTEGHGNFDCFYF